MYSSTSARNAVISIRLAPSRTMASRSRLRSDQSSSPTTMLNMGVPSMDGLSAVLGLRQTGGYATLLSPNSIHNFGLYPGSRGLDSLDTWTACRAWGGAGSPSCRMANEIGRGGGLNRPV